MIEERAFLLLSKIGSSTLEQEDYTLKTNIGSYSLENDRNVNSEVKQIQTVDLQIDAEDHKRLLKPSQQSEDYNLSSNPTTAQNEEGFNLTSERSENFVFGFAEDLPKARANSLFQNKGYQIKYETIRRTKLYQQLKP